MKKIKKIVLLFILSICLAVVPANRNVFASEILVAQMQEKADEAEEIGDDEANPVIIQDPETPLGVDAMGLFQRSKWWLGIAIILFASLAIVVVEFYKKIKENELEEDE